MVASLSSRSSNNNNNYFNKDLLIKRQKSSNDLLNKPETTFNNGLLKENLVEVSLLQQDERVVEIACGTLHTLVKTSFTFILIFKNFLINISNKIKKDFNKILSAGFGETYALGHGDQSTLAGFKMVFNLLKNKNFAKNGEIEKITCGLSHSACITNGKVYIWGAAGSLESHLFRTPTLLEYCVDGNKNRIEFKEIIDLRLGELFSIFLNSKVIALKIKIF